MKAFRRVLAMLAVIAIAVSGFAFAEEPALVAELSETMIEQTAEESAEAIEEPAAEEVPAEAEAAVFAEAAETIVAAEEAPAEESAGAAEEAAAEPASEETGMPETIDAPVVLSLFHRDEVPGNCPHTNEYFTDEGRWNIEVISTDAKNHTIRYEGEDYYYCPDCGYEYYLPIIGQRETTEEHRWAGEHCWVCYYVNTCAHENETLRDTFTWEETVLSTDASTHTISCMVSYYYECPDCGQSRSEYPEEMQTITEAHGWMDNGECWQCGMKNSCTHANRIIHHENYADREVISTDARSHTFSCKIEIYFSCPDCGVDAWETQDEVQTITEPHDWYQNKCWVCEAENNCTHPNAVAEPYTGRRNVKGVSLSNVEHKVTYNECTYYNCPDCSASYDVVSPETTTAIEPHDWYEGYCTECESYNSCTHENLIFEHAGRVAQQLISYDENQHTCVFVERSWYSCPECNERIMEDGKESFTATEAHTWWDGRCEYCPAVNPCTHANQRVELEHDVNIEVISSNEVEHSIRCQVEILLICPDCDQESWMVQDEILTKTENHKWDEGVCRICDYKNSCTHKNKDEMGTSLETIKVISTAALKHVAEVQDRILYECSDCGEEIWQDSGKPYTITAAHMWDDNGFCYECGARTECTHPAVIVNSYYDNYGTSSQVDNHYHTKSYYLTEMRKCPDCGYISIETLSTETRLEEHSFTSDGRCRICSYANSCSHKNTESNDRYQFVSSSVKNSKLHSNIRKNLRITVCLDCGLELSRKETGTETAEAPHLFNYANICDVCNYEGSCAHAKVKKESDKYSFASAYDIGSHIIESYENVFYFCENCGCELDNLSEMRVVGTKLEKHSFKDGLCTECGLFEIECVHEYDKNGKCKLCGKMQNVELESITLVKKLQLAVGQEYQLEPSLTPSNASAELKYSSSKSSIVSVGKNGLLTARKAGEATITVKSGDVEASCVVTVVKAPTGIELNRSRLALRLNDSAQLTASLTPADACADVLWTSSSFDTVSVDQDGRITALSYGTAIITVASEIDPGVKASCTVEVTDAVSEIDLGAGEITLAVKQNYQLNPVMVPEQDGVEFSYSSSNSKVASVSKAGKISALKAGSAVITVSSDTGEEKSMTVTVMKAPSKVTISDKKLTVGAGDSFQLSSSIPADCYTSAFSWSSSNTGVATVDSEGYVTVLKAGKANITVKADNGKSAKCALTVKAAPDSISLSASTLALCEGQDAELTVKLPKNTAARIIWSSDSDAVRVGNGVVTAVKAGTATVYATAANGTASASCTVTVNPAPTAVVTEDVLLVTGQKYTASAKLQAGDQVFDGECSVKLSSGKGVVTVNAKTGLITAKKAGTAVITLTAYNGVSADCTITVVAAPKSIKLSASKKTLTIDESFELSAKLSPTNAYTDGYTVTADKEGIVNVEGEDGNYTITAVAKGKVKITIAASNGKKATCTVTVK